MNGENHIHKLGLKLNFKMDFSDHGNDSQQAQVYWSFCDAPSFLYLFKDYLCQELC